MKTVPSLSQILYFGFFLSCLAFTGCSASDDPLTPEKEIINEPVSFSCSLSGTIDETLADTWKGIISFKSDAKDYEVTNILKSDGTFVGTGDDLEDTFGCWRKTDENITFDLYYLQNGRKVSIRVQTVLFRNDAGTHEATNGEEGEIWFVR